MWDSTTLVYSALIMTLRSVSTVGISLRVSCADCSISYYGFSAFCLGSTSSVPAEGHSWFLWPRVLANRLLWNAVAVSISIFRDMYGLAVSYDGVCIIFLSITSFGLLNPAAKPALVPHFRCGFPFSTSTIIKPSNFMDYSSEQRACFILHQGTSVIQWRVRIT